MEVNIYDEFLSRSEIEFMTGYTQPARQIKRLNELGVPFIEPKGNTKYPVVRREYADKVKRKSKVIIDEPKPRKRSSVLN